MGVHDGHRQRLKERFLKDGLDGFEPHNVLELLLFFAVPQRDTNEIAHQLINHFGSLSGVFDASYEDLMKVKWMGNNCATLIKLIPEISRYYMDLQNQNGVVLQSFDEMGQFVLPKFIGKTKEQVLLVCLDNKGKVIYNDFIIEGTINAAPIYVRNIIEVAIRCSAAAVVLAHNHPNGLALPSNADLTATKSVYDALNAVKINLMDHIIVAGTDYVSLRNSGFFSWG